LIVNGKPIKNKYYNTGWKEKSGKQKLLERLKLKEELIGQPKVRL